MKRAIIEGIILFFITFLFLRFFSLYHPYESRDTEMLQEYFFSSYFQGDYFYQQYPIRFFRRLVFVIFASWGGTCVAWTFFWGYLNFENRNRAFIIFLILLLLFYLTPFGYGCVLCANSILNGSL